MENQVIWKERIPEEIWDGGEIYLPKALVLDAQVQNNSLCIWVFM